MEKQTFLGAFLILILQISLTSCHTEEDALRALLQTGYNRDTRPSIPTNVTATYSLRSLKHLDITTESLKATGFVVLTWYDSRLVWTPSSYGNITTLDVNWVWRPEFVISNSVDEIPKHGYIDEEEKLMIFSTGEVFWGVYFTSETSCKIDTSNFPHDSQTCSIEIAFNYQNYDSNMILTLPYSELDKSVYVDNGEWDWTGSRYEPQVYPLCCPSYKAMVLSLTMTFQRRQSFYIVNILLPIILLSVCVPWAFYINTDSGDRSGYALTMLLSYFVFLTVVSELLPSTSASIPVLAEYLLTVLLLCTFALICVSIQVKLYFIETPPCERARRVYRIIRWLLRMKCCGKDHETPVRPVTAASLKRPLPEDEERNCPSGSSSYLEEDITWKCITITCDRFLFYMYNLAVFIANMALVISLYS